jgi:hypothetical protein
MPEISRFYGIVIFMNYLDHDPPHFHARYGDQEVTIEIETGVVRGVMAKRALKLVFEWADQNGESLKDNWNRARERRPLAPIPPLR